MRTRAPTPTPTRVHSARRNTSPACARSPTPARGSINPRHARLQNAPRAAGCSMRAIYCVARRATRGWRIPRATRCSTTASTLATRSVRRSPSLCTRPITRRVRGAMRRVPRSRARFRRRMKPIREARLRVGRGTWRNGATARCLFASISPNCAGLIAPRRTLCDFVRSLAMRGRTPRRMVSKMASERTRRRWSAERRWTPRRRSRSLDGPRKL